MKQHTVMTPYMVGEVHYYSTELNGELVLFDTGPPTAEALKELERSVDLQRLKHLFITHCHVDHYGLAAYIEERSEARVHFPRYDALRLPRIRDWFEGLGDLLVAAGFDAGFSRRLLEMFQSQEGLPPAPKCYDIAEESESLAALGLSAIACPGHSQSDLVYVGDGFAVSGDLLLRDIFQAPLLGPDVNDFSRRFGNYHAYCASLPKLAGLRGLTILPAHRNFVESVDQTLVFYVRKLLERAGQVRRFHELEKASEVVEAIFGSASINPVTAYIKASEVIFMRDFLAEPWLLKTALEDIGLFTALEELYGLAIGEAN